MYSKVAGGFKLEKRESDPQVVHSALTLIAAAPAILARQSAVLRTLGWGLGIGDWSEDSKRRVADATGRGVRERLV